MAKGRPSRIRRHFRSPAIRAGIIFGLALAFVLIAAVAGLEGDYRQVAHIVSEPAALTRL